MNPERFNAKDTQESIEGMAAAAAALPQRLVDAQAALHAGPLYYAPVRHHSPACAWALAAMLDELQPARILVEGPPALQAMLPLLRDELARPPLAVLVQAEAGAGSFYPLCAHSPEWIALRWQGAQPHELQFIDLPWSARGARGAEDSPQADSLLAERQLAHSRYLSELARRSGCRDHDELWEHCFELRLPDQLRQWREFFAQVHAWCGYARLDYGAAELAAEGNLAREACMLRHLQTALASDDGRPTVVVTGGFHTLGLIEGLAEDRRAKRKLGRQAIAADADRAWLVRYSHDRLDALNGYAAGMPAPGWQQRLWQAWQQGQRKPWRQVALDSLLAFAASQRPLGTEGVSTADLQAALLQAERLAELRGHPGPGRNDLLDAATSCLLKSALDEGGRRLLAELHRALAGNALGDIPPSAGSPPLLEQARSEARALGIRLEDTQARQAELDLHRKPRHRARSRYFQRMDYLGTGLAEWQGGPELVHGIDPGRLKEHWRYAWTPTVEARLLELSSEGTRLDEVALARLLAEEQALEAQGRARSASAAVALLLRGCVLGLQAALPRLCELVARHGREDASLDSLARACSQLHNLQAGLGLLGLDQSPPLDGLIEQLWQASLLQLPTLAKAREGDETALIDALLALRGVWQQRQSKDPRWLEALRLLGDGAATAPGIQAACTALLIGDTGGADPDERLAGQLAQHFGPGAEPAAAVRYLRGLLQAAPQSVVGNPALLRALDDCLARWRPEEFLQYLPDLRQAFSYLKPFETERLARQVAAQHGSTQDLSIGHGHFTAEEVQLGLTVDAQLRGLLVQGPGLRAQGPDAAGLP